MRIVFMGTPDFAVPALRILVENGYSVVGVITAPDKAAGRGLKTKISAVKAYAQSQNLNILQPTNLKNPDFLMELAALKADLQVVVAFRMLPEAVWNMPPKGTFNLHASLLPKYRGAAPIHHAIINGEKESGLTTFFLRHEIDTGPIILQEKMPIGADENVGSLHDRMAEKGANLVLQSTALIAAGEVTPKTQESSVDTPCPKAPKLTKANTQIDWSKSLNELHNFIRGLSPFPTAWTKLEGKPFKIYKATKEAATHNEPIGHLIIDKKDKKLMVSVKGGFLHLERIQKAGKKQMDGAAFVNGYATKEGKTILPFS